MLPLLLTTLTLLAQVQSTGRAPTVLLIPLDAKDNKTTQDYKTAFRLTTREDGVLFDLDGDGRFEQVAWTRSDTAVAFLAIDKNQNGTIDDGRELIGEQVLDGAVNAIDALEQMPQSEDDANDGGPAWINDQDPVYEKLLLWTDANHNGVSEASELRPVSQVLTKIGLGYVRFNARDDHGNFFAFQGWVLMRTAPGPNNPNSREEEVTRLRRMYEVVLRRR